VIGVDREPDRRADIDTVAVKLERLADRQRDAARDSLGVGGEGDAREEDRELVARQPRQQRALLAIFGNLGGDDDPQATMISSWSPRAWPRLSLTLLNRSRSTNSIADIPPSAAVPIILSASARK